MTVDILKCSHGGLESILAKIPWLLLAMMASQVSWTPHPHFLSDSGILTFLENVLGFSSLPILFYETEFWSFRYLMHVDNVSGHPHTSSRRPISLHIHYVFS